MTKNLPLMTKNLPLTPENAPTANEKVSGCLVENVEKGFRESKTILPGT